jgi:hypothetical protein
MQRVALLGFVVGTARGLPIDGHNIGLALAQARDPFAEAGREKFAIECVDDVVERIVARDALSEGQEAPQEPLVDHAPAADLDEVLRPRQSAAQHQEQNLRQGIDYLPALPRVRQHREMVDQGPRATVLRHGVPRHFEVLRESRRQTRRHISRSSDCPGSGPRAANSG